MNLKSVHHIAIIVSDHDRELDFYVYNLGFSVIRDCFRQERKDWKTDLALDGLELEIFTRENPPKRPSYPEACGLRHLAFRVADIEAAVAELAEKGISCEPIRMDPYTKTRMTFFADPDGLPLELHE